MDEILVRFFPHRQQRRQQEEGRKKEEISQTNLPNYQNALHICRLSI